MANILNVRMSAELNKIASDKSDDIGLVPVSDSNFKHLIGSFKGFDNSPYAGGEYKIDIVIPDGFPFKPPKAKFITQVWHPNISSASGCICLDLLKEENWAPALSMKNFLLSIKTLLILPQPDDPQDAVVASQYMNNKEMFDKTASYWNHVFAGGSQPSDFDVMNEKVNSLMEKKSLNKFEAIHELSMNNWNI